MRNHRRTLSAVAVGCELLLAGPVDLARAQCSVNELAKLTASDAAADDRFGLSVSISGDVVVIGAHPDDAGDDTGSAYVYRFNGSDWIEEAELTAFDAAAGDEFGHFVSVSGNAAAIGAPYEDNAGGLNAGSVYVYRFNGGGWVLEVKLTASDPAPADEFGHSVAISENVIVSGVPYHGMQSGSAYVYRFNGSEWIEEAELTASDGGPGDRFGVSVAIDGDVALIGANQVLSSGSGAGYVYRFDGSNWIQEAKLTASDGAVGDTFGISVAIKGDGAVIGAFNDDDAGMSSGSVYVFKKPAGGWVDMTETAKLTASDAAGGDQFGYSVAISGDVAVIGARGDDDGGPGSGSAYVFKEPAGGWVDMSETAKLTASDAGLGDQFAHFVAISGELAVIGARFDDDAGADSGSAYVFGGLSDCNGNDSLDLCDIASGTSDDENDNGVPDECEGAIPAVSEWGMIVMTLLLLTAGTLILFRARAYWIVSA